MSQDFTKNNQGAAIGETYSMDGRVRGYQGDDAASNLLAGIGGDGQGPVQRTSMSLFTGRIIEAVPYTRNYRVKIPHQPDAKCLDGTGGNRVFIPGQQVVVALFPASLLGVIVGAPPDFSPGGPGSAFPGTYLLGGGPTGIASPYFSVYLNNDTVSGMSVTTEQVRTDEVPGDVGYMNEFDVGWLASTGMFLARANDTASIEMHAYDSLVRINALNYELFSSGVEHRIFNDEGELHNVLTDCKFPWEELGVTAPGVEAVDEANQEDFASFAAAVEPKDQAQMAAARMVELRSYLGDMFRRQVLRHSDAQKETPLSYGEGAEDDGPVALFDEHISANGAYHISSAKEIIFQKRVTIPALQQLRLPDDNVEGDFRATYKASGEYGGGDDPQEQLEFPWPESDIGTLQPAWYMDYLAYLNNWYSNANVVSHAKDWRVRDEGAPSSGWPFESSYMDKALLESIKDSFWAKAPPALEVEIDSRMAAVFYRQSTATVAMTETGGLLFEDGWGSQIIMEGSNIIIAPAGDVIFAPGRRIVGMAGRDIILRARHNIDMTTTEGDIRQKADRNLMFLAGNDRDDKKGGILFETRSEGSDQDFTQVGEATVMSGINFLSRKSPVNVIGDVVYVGATGEGQQRSNLDPAIVLDAARTERPVYVEGSKFLTKAEELVTKYGEDDKYAYSSKEMWFNETEQLVVGGSITAMKSGGKGGNVIAEANVVAKGELGCFGNIYSKKSLACGGLVYGKQGISYYSKEKKPTMVGGTDIDVSSAISDIEDKIDDYATRLRKFRSAVEDYAETMMEAVRAENSMGNEDLYKSMGVSLRTDSDYGAPDFALHLMRWQVVMKDLTEEWEERPVKMSVGGDTYPFPGREHYEQAGAILSYANPLYNFEEGKAAGRDAYEAVEIQEPEKLTMNQYPVLKFE